MVAISARSVTGVGVHGSPEPQWCILHHHQWRWKRAAFRGMRLADDAAPYGRAAAFGEQLLLIPHQLQQCSRPHPWNYLRCATRRLATDPPPAPLLSAGTHKRAKSKREGMANELRKQRMKQ